MEHVARHKKSFSLFEIPASFLPSKTANAKTDFSYLKISLRHMTFAKHHHFLEGGKKTHDCINMWRACAQFESFGQVRFLVSQLALVLGRQQLGIPFPLRAPRSADVVSDLDTSRRLAGHDGGSTRAADLAGSVTPCEFHPFTGDSINVGTLVKGAPFIAQVTPAEIIGQDKQHIRLVVLSGLRWIGGPQLSLQQDNAEQQRSPCRYTDLKG